MAYISLNFASVSFSEVPMALLEKVDLAHAKVVANIDLYMEEYANGMISGEKIFGKFGIIPEDYVVLGIKVVDDSYYCEYEHKMEYLNTTYVLVAPLEEDHPHKVSNLRYSGWAGEVA